MRPGIWSPFDGAARVWLPPTIEDAGAARWCLMAVVVRDQRCVSRISEVSWVSRVSSLRLLAPGRDAGAARRPYLT